jgi:hypothetical protein
MLFRPGDLFEVRLKRNDENGAKQVWLPYEKLENFVSSHIPIHTEHERHIWVGVAPRGKVGDATPVLHRALWADFNSTITTIEQAESAIRASGVPAPTMLVWSGNGVHGYWALTEPASPEQVRPHAKGVHDALPADATHDSTRIMRVPGTINCKNPAAPKLCYIAQHHPERTYALSEFPRSKQSALQVEVRPGSTPSASMRPLSREDRELFLSRWIDGDKHRMVLAVAGYLRKNLGYDLDSAVREISSIHKEAGHEVDDGLVKAVQDTYSRLWATVAGLRTLEELGIRPNVTDNIEFRIVRPPKPKIEVIDFSSTMESQQFWVHGLVGPGLLTLWAAAPKVGKSFAAMQLGHALATGNSLWDFETSSDRLRVLYFQGELSKGMVYGRAKAMFGLGAIRDPRRFALTAKPDQAIDLVKNPEVLTDLAADYDVVIVDPISVFTTNDETRSHSVNEVVNIFDPLRAQGKGVVLVHHLRKLQTNRDGSTPEPSFNDIRGSVAFYATADAIALQYRVGTGHNTRVKFEFRAAPEREPLTLFRLPHGGFTHDRELYAGATTPRTTLSYQVN